MCKYAQVSQHTSTPDQCQESQTSEGNTRDRENLQGCVVSRQQEAKVPGTRNLLYACHMQDQSMYLMASVHLEILQFLAEKNELFEGSDQSKTWPQLGVVTSGFLHLISCPKHSVLY